MNIRPIIKTAILVIVTSLPFAAPADEWSDAGFTSMHRVVWNSAGFTLREAKRWKSRCGIIDPAQVAEWENIGLSTPMAVSIWMKKGFTTPESVVRARNGELAEPMTLTPSKTRQQVIIKQKKASLKSSSERKKREWQRKRQIETLIASGIDRAKADEWIFAGYSSDEARGWLKVEGIQLPDDLSVWLDIGIDSPEALQAWYAKGLTSADAVEKQLAFEKREREKFARLGISPEMVKAWQKIGAMTFNQVNYLIKRDYTVEELRSWMAAGFITLKDIEAWRATGLSITASRQWRNHGFLSDEVDGILADKFSLEQIVAWQKLFGPYARAANRINHWRSAGFNPASAAQWIGAHQGVSAATAANWRDNGYQPESEWVLLETTPDVVEPWRNSEQSPAQILLWIKSGFDEPTAQQWISRGIDTKQAKMWRDHDYTPSTAKMWSRQGVKTARRADRLKAVTIDVSERFSRGVTYNAFRKTAKLLNIHKLPAKFIAKRRAQNRSVSHFDTLTPFAKCMTAYATKDGLSDSAVMDIENAHFYQTEMKQMAAKKFMQRYSGSCEDWTRYIFTIWFNREK